MTGNIIETVELSNLHVVCRSPGQENPREIRILKSACGSPSLFELERYVHVNSLSPELRDAIWKEIGKI